MLLILIANLSYSDLKKPTWTTNVALQLNLFCSFQLKEREAMYALLYCNLHSTEHPIFLPCFEFYQL